MARLPLTPHPATVELADGWLDLTAGAHLLDHTDGRALAVVGAALNHAWGGPGLGAPVTIRLDGELAPQHYHLRVGRTRLELAGGDHAGVLYGLMTLTRLLRTRTHPQRMRAMRVADGPLTPVRGLCLDLGRRYCPPATLRSIIDAMAWLGLNRLQLHLTEWNGWRVALADPRYCAIASPQSYPAAQLRDLIDYAHQRAISVSVELNLPAHATALIHAVPQLRPRSGDWAISDGAIWTGAPTDGWMVDVASPVARAYLRDLLAQCVAEVPADAYHLGGDEWYDELRLAQAPSLAVAAARMGGRGVAAPRSPAASLRPADVVVDFMNALARPLLDAGHQVEMWSWPAFFAEHRCITLDQRITVTAWDAQVADIAKIAAAGYRVIASPELTHYVTPRTAPGNLDGVNFVPALSHRLWKAPTLDVGLGAGSADAVPPRCVGEQLCVWADWAEDEPDDYFAWYSWRAIVVLAARLWGRGPGSVDDVVRAADACGHPVGMRLTPAHQRAEVLPRTAQPCGEVPLREQRVVRGGVGNFAWPHHLLAVRIYPRLTARPGVGKAARRSLLELDEWRGVGVEVRAHGSWRRVVTLERQLTDTWNRIDVDTRGVTGVRLCPARGRELPPGDVEWLLVEPP